MFRMPESLDMVSAVTHKKIFPHMVHNNPRRAKDKTVVIRHHHTCQRQSDFPAPTHNKSGAAELPYVCQRTEWAPIFIENNR